MTSQDIRNIFLEYFASRGHQVVPSSSLIPHNDPTLLFVNAGMVQFKDVFLGVEQRPYHRAVTIQRCVRAGGKHNDLDEVGKTKRHHTFFEMLGNFSFGDYFKREAIQYAWELLTEVFKIPAEKLWVTVYKDDPESEKIWLEEMGVDPERFSRCGDADNFWSMGDTGPCGPCTEIFYDHGPEIGGGPPGTPEQEGDRYVEIWNLVFMQYERDAKGQLTPLPKPSVDTGMGLERIAAVLQGVHDNYDIDTFKHLLAALSDILGCHPSSNTSMRVIVDHIRSCAFLIADGVTPSNEGRGYVLRRIIRRAVRHGYLLGQAEPFFHKMVAPLVDIMGEAYPILAQAQAFIENTLLQEEQQFSKTLANGLKILDEAIAKLPGWEIPGQLAFTLYDTYGFPLDLTEDIARERNLSIDHAGFDAAMAKQRETSQAASHFTLDPTVQLDLPGDTEFTGYHRLEDQGQILALFVGQAPRETLTAGEEGIVVLDRTPFYAESGGQVGDRGVLQTEGARFRVLDTKKVGKTILHYGKIESGALQSSDAVTAIVDPDRQAIVLNHTATHLLHAALREILGAHVVQKGSLVEAQRLRFDFSHSQALTPTELQAVEHLVNQNIRANLPSEVHETTLEDAQAQGALALFGEKYEEQVRVVKMGDFSTELCGGTHAARSGDIGLFKITNESACAAGIRRIEAVTGKAALLWVERLQAQLQDVSLLLKTRPEQVADKLLQIVAQQRQTEKQLQALKQQVAQESSGDMAANAVVVGDIHVVATMMDTLDRDTLRNAIDQLKQRLGCSAIVLAGTDQQKVVLVAGLTKDCLTHFNASELLNHVAQQIDGKGGGRPDFAQGGGVYSDALQTALDSVPDWVAQKVS